MFSRKFVEGNLSVVSDMALYYTQYKHTVFPLIKAGPQISAAL